MLSGGKVTVPPLLATAVTFSTLVPAGADTGTAAQVAAAGAPLVLEMALAAMGTSSAVAAGTAAAIKMIRRRFMLITLAWRPSLGPRIGPWAAPWSATRVITPVTRVNPGLPAPSY